MRLEIPALDSKNPRLYRGFCGTYLFYVPVMVEMRRIELLSENRLPKLSTSVADVLKFPLCSTQRQVLQHGSLLNHDASKGGVAFTFTTHRRLIPGRGVPG